MNRDALLAGGTGLISHALAAEWARTRHRNPGKTTTPRAHSAGTLHLLLRQTVDCGAHQQVHVVDFERLPLLPAADSAFCCLGTTLKVDDSQEAFRAVDHTAVLAFARAAQAAGVRRFAVVSALGANPQAPYFYHRLKGEMEAELTLLGFSSLVIARPALLVGGHTALHPPPRLGKRLALAVAAPLGTLLPPAWRPLKALTVARALLRAVAEAQPGVRVLESAALRRLGA